MDQAVHFMFEVQMQSHCSIDGCAGVTRGLRLGQHHRALHRKACSTGTLGHMPPPSPGCYRAAEAHKPSLMRRRPRLLCPLALWIRKVLLWLSGRVSNIDLNSLTPARP